MANTYKNIVITPNRDTDAANVPVIRFSGGDASTNTDINVRVYTSQSGTLSFEGSAGQLFSITNDLTNSIFSVNDVSGIPSIDVYANGNILLAPFGGQVFVGNTANLNFDSTASTKIVDPAANTLAFHTAQTERMRIDSSGFVGIGTSSPTTRLNIYDATNATLIVSGDSATSIVAARYSTDATGAFVNTRKYRGTFASPTAIASGDSIGGTRFSGYGGTNLRILASVNAFVDTYTSDSDISSYLTFATSSSGAASATDRMRIDPTGNLLIGRTTSTVGQSVKLDVNGAINASAVLVNGSAISGGGITTGKAIAMAIVFG